MLHRIVSSWMATYWMNGTWERKCQWLSVTSGTVHESFCRVTRRKATSARREWLSINFTCRWNGLLSREPRKRLVTVTQVEARLKLGLPASVLSQCPCLTELVVADRWRWGGGGGRYKRSQRPQRKWTQLYAPIISLGLGSYYCVTSQSHFWPDCTNLMGDQIWTPNIRIILLGFLF